LTTLVDTGLLIALLNRTDQHHRWAVDHVLEARERQKRLAIPSAVVGEAYTRVRYDRAVSPRRDARPALRVFALTGQAQDVFEVRALPSEHHRRAGELLYRYRDHPLSYIDAIVFLSVDDDPRIDRVLTVDRADFTAYQFSRPVVVEAPGDGSRAG
jgi:predicted nucleic acid-binding protein